MPSSGRITLFKWGYGGWGNATKTLVRTIDASERALGYEPPIFVDIRYSRSVRAIGFRDRAFEQQLGHARYRWMRSLGNASIGTGARKMRIQCADAAHQLLDLALDAADADRRVIFFCSCVSPHGAEWCHRTKVAKLVARAARSRGARVQIEEWPGGTLTKSVAMQLRVSDAELRRVRNGAKNVLLSPRQVSDALASLPWGTLVELVAPAASQLISAGPASYRARRWQLPIFLFPVQERDRPGDLAPYASRLRAQCRLNILRP